MLIDLDKLTEQELRALNQEIVQRIRALQQRRTQAKMIEFVRGQHVIFEDRFGAPIFGRILGCNQKTISVLAEDGTRWNVSPGLLRIVEDAAPADKKQKAQQLTIEVNHPEQNAAKVENVFELRVDLKRGGNVWRKIAIAESQTLHDLHLAIFEAFARDDPHLYSFYIPSHKAVRKGAGHEYVSPDFDMREAADEGLRNAFSTKLSQLGLKQGKSFEYRFDYGDCWDHLISVKGVRRDVPGPYPLVTERRGVAPRQYQAED